MAYISMAFGNPYGDPWDETEVLRGDSKTGQSLGIGSISLADTVGMAGPDLIRRVFESVRASMPIATSASTFTARQAKRRPKCLLLMTQAVGVSIRPSAALVDVHSRRTRWLETFPPRA